MKRSTVRVYQNGEEADADAASDLLEANGISASVEANPSGSGSSVRVDLADREEARKVLVVLDDGGVDIDALETEEPITNVGWWAKPALAIGWGGLAIAISCLLLANYSDAFSPAATMPLGGPLAVLGVVLVVLAQWGRAKREHAHKNLHDHRV